MTPEEQRLLAKLLRKFQVFRAERRALITILKEAARDRRPPYDWEKELHRLQESPEYYALLVEFEPIALQLEQGADFDELIPLIQKISEGKLPN